MDWREEERRRREETARAIKQRQAEVDARDSAGFRAAAKANENAMPPVELAEVVVIAPRRKAAPRRSGLRENGRAALSGAVDELTFGAADHAGAVVDALFGKGEGGLGARYKQSIARKHAEDTYDAQHYGAARTSGKVAGAVGGIVLMGAPGLAKAVVTRAPKVASLLTRVDPRGLTTLATGAGAASGVAGQVTSDVLRQDLGTPGDYVGAAVGGAVGGLDTIRGGALRGGATGGAVTSVAQDVLNGRPVSVERAASSAHVGGTVGHVAGEVGERMTAALPALDKGRIGERLSFAKALGRGKVATQEGRKVDLPGHKTPKGKEKYSLPDWRIGKDRIEAKMGPSAELTGNQKLAMAKLAAEKHEFIVDRWRFEDTGKVLSIPSSAFGAPSMEERRPWRR